MSTRLLAVSTASMRATFTGSVAAGCRAGRRVQYAVTSAAATIMTIVAQYRAVRSTFVDVKPVAARCVSNGFVFTRRYCQRQGHEMYGWLPVCYSPVCYLVVLVKILSLLLLRWHLFAKKNNEKLNR
jgi:hypothetical protein